MDVLLDIGTGLSLVVLVLWALTQLRDEAVHLGWISRNTRLGRMSARAEAAKIAPVLAELGINDEDAHDIRRVRDVRRAERHVGHLSRPDAALIERLATWTFELTAPYNFRGSGYYVDLMGAIHHRRSHEPSLAQILFAWITLLQRHSIISDFDCLFTPKGGNPLLAHDLCSGALLGGRKQAIVCKGPSDPARVTGPITGHHPTEFEGLEAALRRPEFEDTNRRLSTLAVDDSCTSGETMCSAIGRFNEFARSSHPLARRVEPIKDVVILFRVIERGKSAASQDAFRSADVRLHALVSLRPDDMELLVKNRNPRKPDSYLAVADRCKSDKVSCDQSLQLLSAQRRRKD